MPQQIINVGTLPNDGTGDPLRTAYTKTNDNFTELFSAVAAYPLTSIVDDDYIVDETDYIILVDNAAVAHTITLQHTAEQGKLYIIKKTTTGSSVTINTNNVLCTIDGAATYTLTGKEAVSVVMGNNGTDDVYYIVGKFS